jgi:hypothetical protein
MDPCIGVLILAAIVIGISKAASYTRSTTDPDKSLASVQNHDVQGGIIQSWHEAKKFDLQGKAIEAKTRVAAGVVNLQNQQHAVEIAKTNREIALKKAKFDEQMAPFINQWQHDELDVAHRVNIALGEAAIENKLDPVNYQLVAVTKAQADIDIHKHRELKRIDSDAALLEQLNTIQAILTFKHIKFDELDEIRKRIFDLIREEEEIESTINMSAHAKEQYLQIIGKSKEALREVLNDRTNRLVEARHGEEIGGMEAFDSIFGGLRTDTKSGDQNAISVIKHRDRGTDSDSPGGDA